MAEGLTGSLAQLPLSDILTMLSAGGQSGRLELLRGERGETSTCARARLYTLTGVRAGEAALGGAARWPGGAFRFQPQVLSPEATIDKPLEQLFSEGDGTLGARAVLRIVPSAASGAALSRRSAGQHR